MEDIELVTSLFSGLFIFIFFVVFIFYIICMWKVYTKSGKPGWAVLIPFYNYLVFLEIIGRPWWWLLLLLIPCVNIIIFLIIEIDLAKCFGYGAGFGFGLFLLPFIFYPILAFGNSNYIGPVA